MKNKLLSKFLKFSFIITINVRDIFVLIQIKINFFIFKKKNINILSIKK